MERHASNTALHPPIGARGTHRRSQLQRILSAAPIVLIAASLLVTHAYAAGLSLSPTSGAAGSAVTASGSGFLPGESVQVRWAQYGAVLAEVTASAPGGAFSASFSVPSSAIAGSYSVWAVGGLGSYTPATFVVTGGAVATALPATAVPTAVPTTAVAPTSVPLVPTAGTAPPPSCTSTSATVVPSNVAPGGTTYFEAYGFASRSTVTIEIVGPSPSNRITATATSACALSGTIDMDLSDQPGTYTLHLSGTKFGGGPLQLAATFRVVAAPEPSSGVAAPRFGDVPAPTFGDVPTPTFGDVAAPTYGSVPAAAFGDVQIPNSGDPTDPNAFDLYAFPRQVTTFEEQRIVDTLRDPNTTTIPFLLGFAHRQLGRYYAERGRADLAATEYARAILAYPFDRRSYDGLAAIIEGVGADFGGVPAPTFGDVPASTANDGVLGLRDVAQQLENSGYAPEGPSEPDPAVVPNPNPGQWQEVSAEFNRRMNYLYTSPSWNSLYRTVFPNLYGR